MTIITPGWVKDAVFYQVFPDRFARSERLNREGLHFESWDSTPTSYGFKGGDLFGLAEHLDYLQDLGITAIYLNPIFASASNHRYHTYDYYTVDPLLGGNNALRTLLKAAHRRDMRILLDGVFNHASRGFWQFHHVLENGRGSPYIDWFYFDPDRLDHRKHWGAYPTPEEQALLNRGTSSYEALGYRAWWNLPALPKFNTQTAAVRRFIFEVAEYWIKFGADGWRLDVPAEIDDDSFWREFRRCVKDANPEAYIVGEIWHEAQRWLQGDQFDAVMNYLLTGALLGFLIGNKLDKDIAKVGEYGQYVRPLDAPGFADRIDYLFSLYDPAVTQVQLNLLDSHDTPRFLTTAHGDRSAMELGWLLLFTFPGAPCIYYGDEVGLDGTHDPDCRKAFPWEKNRWDHSLHDYVKNLALLRRNHVALRQGSFQRLVAGKGVYAFGRQLDGEVLIVAINSSQQVQRFDLPVHPLGLADGPLAVVFGQAQAPSVGAGQVSELELGPRRGIVLKR